jgi:hypothetical protein
MNVDEKNSDVNDESIQVDRHAVVELIRNVESIDKMNDNHCENRYSIVFTSNVK